MGPFSRIRAQDPRTIRATPTFAGDLGAPASDLPQRQQESTANTNLDGPRPPYGADADGRWTDLELPSAFKKNAFTGRRTNLGDVGARLRPRRLAPRWRHVPRETPLAWTMSQRHRRLGRAPLAGRGALRVGVPSVFGPRRTGDTAGFVPLEAGALFIRSSAPPTLPMPKFSTAQRVSSRRCYLGEPSSLVVSRETRLAQPWRLILLCRGAVCR